MIKSVKKVLTAIMALTFGLGLSGCAMASPEVLTVRADTPTAEGICNPSFTAITSEIEEESLGQVVVEDFSENCTSSNSIYPNLKSFHLGKVGYYMYQGQNTAENPGVLDVAYTLKEGVTLTAGETYYLSMDYATGWSANYNVGGKVTVLLREAIDASSTVALEIAEIDVSVEVDEDNRIFSFEAPDSGTYYLGFDLTGSLQGQLYRFNVGDIAIGQNFHSYSGNCATTCENCESLRTVSVSHTLVNGICSVCGEEIKIVVNMADDYGDGWNGAALEIYADGELISSETMPDNEPEWSTSIPYDKNTTYVFKWTKGSYDNECAFTIIVDGEEKFSVDDCRDYKNDEIIYTIESQCEHAFDEGGTTCTLCERTCGEQFLHSFEGNSVCAVCGFECGVTENHDWSNKDGVCVRCSTVCEHSFVDYVCTICNYSYVAGVIKENETEYTAYQTLSEAFLVAAENENSTVFLLTDVSLDDYETVDSGKFTIDLNGYTWTSSSWALYVEGNAWLTITDTSEAQSGLLTATYGGRSTVVLIDSATLEIAGGTICHEDGQMVVRMDSSGNPVNSNLIFSGGVIKGYGGISASGNSVTVIGGTMDMEIVDIYWHQGTLDLSQYQNPHGMIIDIYHEDMTANPLLLPEGYELVEDGYDYMVVHTAHEGGTATCTVQAECTVCGESYGELAAHEYDNACDGNCNVCLADTREPAAHMGGEATCTVQAVCTVCGEPYGELAAHTGGEATCTVQAVCTVCGESYGELAAHEYDNACDGNCNVCLADTREPAAHEGGEATCTLQAVCTVCGESYGELAAHEADENGRCKYGCGAIYAFKVNEEYYLTLEKALVVASEIENSTLFLLANVSLDYYLKVNSGKFTIDLNGYTWTSSSWALYVEGNAWLTITDTSEAQTGMLVGTRQGHPTIVLKDVATLNVAGGTIGHDVSSIINITESGNPVNADFILSGGVLKGRYGILAQGNSVTITGGTIDSKNYDILWHQGTLDLSQYQNPHGMIIDIQHEDETAYPLLPEGYELVEDGYDYMVVHTAHEGGTATCMVQAVCTVCGESYGELAAHEYDNACDGKCNVCNVDTREPAAHVDADSNGKCDVCEADVPVAPPVNPDNSSSGSSNSSENTSSPDNSSEEKPSNSTSNSSSAAPITPPTTSSTAPSTSSEKEGCSGTVSGLTMATLALGSVAVLFKKRKEN